MSATDRQVLERWHENAAPWIAAIRNQEIGSRKLATDAAIVSAVLATRPKTVLDVGRGEGWLVRELARLGIPARGVDAVAALIDETTRQKATSSLLPATKTSHPVRCHGRSIRCPTTLR